MTATPPPPSQWPTDISNVYTPIRIIGTGGFASVWMAKKKDSNDDHVAIKLMKDDGYAKREIAILSELSSKYKHPNILQLIHNCKSDNGINCAVLSLARGPTLNHIITNNGALGMVIAQSISRQLIDAVAFLHGHAVIHRDIQPCNIIVSGSQTNNELWFSDDFSNVKVIGMAKQCRITIVDFGFARALCPSDVGDDIGLKKVHEETENKAEESNKRRQYNKCNIDEPLVDVSLDKSGGKKSRGRQRDDLGDSSISQKKIRDLSALGTRSYTAPEILSGIRNLADTLTSSFHSQRSGSAAKRKESLAECVSSYGMVCDAFSVGTTIRHMISGVPPDKDVEEFIAHKNRLLKKLLKSFKKDETKRAKVYRLGSDIPTNAKDLIQVLTHYNPRSRATVRSVTNHSFLMQSGEGEVKPAEYTPRKKEAVVYLKCGGE